MCLRAPLVPVIAVRRHHSAPSLDPRNPNSFPPLESLPKSAASRSLDFLPWPFNSILPRDNRFAGKVLHTNMQGRKRWLAQAVALLKLYGLCWLPNAAFVYLIWGKE